MWQPRGLPRWVRLGAFCLVLQGFFASEASAQSPKDQAEAKQLWTRGRQSLAAGKVDEAVEKFQAASELHAKPQYLLDLARVLVQTGELVVAVELLNQVSTTNDPSSGLAIAAAKKLLKEVEPRLPWIKITVKGPPAGEAVTTIDGERVDASGEIPFNPGEYAIAAEADGFTTGAKTVTLKEGAHEEVILQLEATAADAPKDEAAVEEEDDDGGSSIVPPLIAFAAGAAGVGLGIGFGAVAFGQTSDIEERCGGNVCPPEEQGALDEAKRSGTISTVGFVIGGVGVATGIVLLLASGGDEEDDVGALTPVIGPGQLGVRGHF